METAESRRVGQGVPNWPSPVKRRSRDKPPSRLLLLSTSPHRTDSRRGEPQPQLSASHVAGSCPCSGPRGGEGGLPAVTRTSASRAAPSPAPRSPPPPVCFGEGVGGRGPAQAKS